MLESLRRPDWLDELRRLLGIAVVLSGIGTAVSTVAVLAGRPVEVTVAGSALALPALPAGVSAADGIPLRLDDPTAAQRGWELLSTLPGYALLTLALVLLWRLTGQARRGDPFTVDVARRLRRLGLLLVAAGPIVWVTEFLGDFALSAGADTGGVYATLDLTAPAAWALAGFGALAVGEIVRRGQAMRVELDGVV
ncbi:DUF2975 domain-containing protein [Paractinoplanes durhamensis]|uniref:DUF2975 domain-containing protein n=1 Tax=Paractinoplanes durhamensis TaxID=113563 RepID=A0ABQ3Z2R1_9ACTN|nr:DUF2975 domain-containing protein [Actinoplanes durhamensis]GIE04122.1 hypothetical protein Adu01nite_54720 [Actinoplanes durhamensis]